MGFEEIAVAFALLGLGLVFRPLGWLAAIGALIILIAAIEFWYLVLPAIIVFALGFSLINEKIRRAKRIRRRAKAKQHDA